MSDVARKHLLSVEQCGESDLSPSSESNSECHSEDEDNFDPLRSSDAADLEVFEEVGEVEVPVENGTRFGVLRHTFGKRKSPTERTLKRNANRVRRLREEAEGSSNAEVIYEMEGGYKDSSSRSSSESLALANEKWNQPPSSHVSLARLLWITFGITAIFLLLSYGSYKASRKASGTRFFTNGTHSFEPTTILISLDGFRADFVNRGLTPAMRALIQSGVSPAYMLPSFPSLTFPNHFTLVTGLYPESHGIVSNQFWDPSIGEEFYYTNISNSMQPKWWNAEPIWVTAEKAGLRTAIHMWPGSEAHIDNMDPTYLDKYNGSENLNIKVERILSWLDLPSNKRPRLIGAYVPNVDSDGHKYGPNSTQIRATIAEVDNMLTNLIEGLFHRNLTEVVNLVIVSDHGMATTSNERLIQLDDFIDMSLVDHIDGWPLRGLRLKNPARDVPLMYEQLLSASKSSAFDVYTLENMPERFHFTKNDRIAPLWVVPQVGWAVVEKTDFDVTEARLSGEQYHPLGLHGYDHEHPLMRAIFIARGPAFPHPPNSRVAPFQNIEVYNIICDSLGIEPFKNNGTLRLPLTTEGLHNDSNSSPVALVDPPAEDFQGSPTSQDGSSLPSTTESASALQTTSPTENSANGTNSGLEIIQTKSSSWWDFLHNQIDKAKDWAKALIDSIRQNAPSEDRQPV